jgi:hypothetical protein
MRLASRPFVHRGVRVNDGELNWITNFIWGIEDA